MVILLLIMAIYGLVVLIRSILANATCAGTILQLCNSIPKASHFVITYLPEYELGSALTLPSPQPSPDRRGRYDSAELFPSSRNPSIWNLLLFELTEYV
jgi:hypothetical protein